MNEESAATMYLISKAQLDTIEVALVSGAPPVRYSVARACLDEARENPLPEPTAEDVRGILKPVGPDADEAEYVASYAADHPVPMYAISEVALEDLESIILGHVSGENLKLGLGFIRAARENRPIQSPEVVDIAVGTVKAMLSAVEQERDTATRQRDFLTAHVDSLIQRLAASQVTAGLIDFRSAHGYVEKESAPIRAMLAQMQANEEG